MSYKAEIARRAVQRDVEAVTKLIYQRSMQGEDTGISDVLPLMYVRTRYQGGAYVTTSSDGAKQGFRECESYTRSVMRRVAAQHPSIARRIHL